MLDNKTSYLKIVLLFFTIVLSLVVLFYMFDEGKSISSSISYINENEEVLKFNYDSGYYDKSIKVRIKNYLKILRFIIL